MAKAGDQYTFRTGNLWSVCHRDDLTTAKKLVLEDSLELLVKKSFDQEKVDQVRYNINKTDRQTNDQERRLQQASKLKRHAAAVNPSPAPHLARFGPG